MKTRDELNCIECSSTMIHLFTTTQCLKIGLRGFPSCVQEAAGAFCTEDLGKDVIFLPIHQAAWLEKSQAQGHAYVREMLAQTSWAYCQGIARAIHIWTGENVAWLATVKQLHSRLLQFQGGNCRIESYEPRFVETSVASLLWKVLSCA